MWKKERDEVTAPDSAPRWEGTRSERQDLMAVPGTRATIGRSISIRGEVTGDEDLVIQGRVEGSVNLKQHAVTVGPEGDVKANITARVVAVEGRVQGNLVGDEQVILRSSARVEGDIAAPRVVFEDGILFRGSVEMGEVGDQKSRSGTAATPPKRAPEEATTPATAPKAPRGAVEEPPPKGKPATGSAAELGR